MLIKDKTFYKTFFRLCSILIIKNVIVLMTNLADNIMIGGYSETALSGVAAVNQIQFVFQQIIMSAGDALVAIGSQYWGQKRTNPIKQLTKGALFTGLSAGVLLFLLATFIPSQMLSLFTSSKDIIAQGTEYLHLIKYTYILFAASNLLLASLRSVESVKIAFLASSEAFVVNCIINFLLINGNLGAPRLGVTGAAIGTLTARAVELITVVIYLCFKDCKLSFKKQDFIHTDFSLIKDYTKTAIFFMIVGAMFGASTALQTVILGHMNDSAIAANSVATALFQILKVASVGAASAASVMIGKAIGNGDRKLIKQYTKTLQVIFLMIGLATSLLLFVLRAPILSLYDLSEQTKQMANEFLLILCITCIGTAYEMPVLTGIVRGGGDSKFVFWNDLISIWGIVLPISFLAAFVFHWPPVAVLFCLNSDQIFKCAAAAIKVNRYRWIKKLTR